MSSLSPPTAATREEARDFRALAILSLCGAVGAASTMDAAFKWLSGNYPLQELLAVRCAVATPFLYVILRLDGQRFRLFPPFWPLILLRGLVMGSAYLAFVMAIATIPMADAVAVYFTLPLFIAVLAFPVLGERVPGHRWIAILAGFIGVMVMIRPGSGVLEPASLLALYSAFGYGLGQLITRRIGPALRSSALALHQNLLYLVIALLFTVAFAGFSDASDTHPSLRFLMRPWMWPTGVDIAVMLSLGLLAAAAMTLFVRGYRLAEPSLVAPFEYTAMFWAVLYGALLFGDLPDLATLLGAALVIGAGLYMLDRDRRHLTAARAGAITRLAAEGERAAAADPATGEAVENSMQRQGACARGETSPC